MTDHKARKKSLLDAVRGLVPGELAEAWPYHSDIKFAREAVCLAEGLVACNTDERWGILQDAGEMVGKGEAETLKEALLKIAMRYFELGLETRDARQRRLEQQKKAMEDFLTQINPFNDLPLKEADDE